MHHYSLCFPLHQSGLPLASLLLPPRELRLPAAITAGLTMEGSCCFWQLARTTIRTVRAGWAALAVLAGVKHLVRVSIEHAIFELLQGLLERGDTAGSVQRKRWAC